LYELSKAANSTDGVIEFTPEPIDMKALAIAVAVEDVDVNVNAEAADATDATDADAVVKKKQDSKQQYYNKQNEEEEANPWIEKCNINGDKYWKNVITNKLSLTEPKLESAIAGVTVGTDLPLGIGMSATATAPMVTANVNNIVGSTSSSKTHMIPSALSSERYLMAAAKDMLDTGNGDGFSTDNDFIDNFAFLAAAGKYIYLYLYFVQAFCLCLLLVLRVLSDS
jgi:hypothetical protein